MQTDGIGLELEDRVVHKVFKRLIWFLFALFVVAFLNRLNISFAAPAMNKGLALTATAYALANTAFYIGYVSVVLPSNLILAKVGARIWIPLIMMAVGVASTATALSVGVRSLVLIRFVAGLAEGGFVPGILLYITYWFPNTCRARANAIFLVAQPITIVCGSSISGLILDMNSHLGLAGWRWLFLVEGLPALFMGIVASWYLTDKPSKAKWLTVEEKEILGRTLDRERGSEKRVTASATKHSDFREIVSRDSSLLMLAYFGLVMSLSANGVWLPLIVREAYVKNSLSSIGLISAIPSFCTIFAMLKWSRRSDRFQERRWHTVLPMALACIGWIFVAGFKIPELRVLGLVFTTVGAYCAMSVFWTLPPLFLSRNARPAGIAVINTAGMLAAVLSPMMIGLLKDLTHSFAAGLWPVTAMTAAAAICILLISKGQDPIELAFSTGN